MKTHRRITLLALMAAAAAGPSARAAETLAGWHEFSTAYQDYGAASSSKVADEYLGGISASLYGGNGARDTWGSTDGSYGSVAAVENASTDGAMSLRVSHPNLYLTLINNTSSPVSLESVVFDLASVSTNAPQDVTLYYDSGDLAVAADTVVNTLSGANSNGLANVSDYADYNWSLSGLADTMLAAGERAVFRIHAENASNATQALALDNIAIMGTGTAGGSYADAMSRLKEHINGVDALSTAEITAIEGMIGDEADTTGDTAGLILQALDLVTTYETEVGALFENGTTNGGFSRTDKSTVNLALAHAMISLYQAVFDHVYSAGNLAGHRDLLDGYKFESADYFPGEVASPTDPDAVYSVQINASQPEAWGYEVMFQYESARRPTGAYLAPGDIATVTVPEALVGRGYEIRVGAHVADLSNRTNNYKRLNRVTLTYPIDSTTTEICSPLGGGIYIEVPYGVEAGLATVEIRNAVRSPFYSNSSARQTTLEEWQDTERGHPGPWADLETDKFMLTVPTDWIYAFNDPVSLMANWDLAMDACSDLQGLPRVRPKTVLYCIIDVTLDASVYSPGYPQSNDNYDPTSSAGGNKDHDYLNGPKFANYVHLHEFGHAAYLTKFSGEVEALVNFLYVAVHNRMFDVTLDEAFGRSMGNYGCRSVSRDQAALLWILSDEFRAGSAMTASEMKYQHRGYGKYTEIAGLFGWDALGDFWNSVAVDYENGIEYSRNSDPADSRILRMSRAAGCDLRPLIHFWGVHPVDADGLAADMEAEGLAASAAIHDRLVYYQSIIPQTVSAFEAHYQLVKNAPIDSDFFDTMRTGWNSSYAGVSHDKVQEIIDLYFPDGRPIASLPHFEGFEDGIGDWAQATDDDFEWRRQSGGTFTASAGPDGASSGDYYMVAEGHDAGGSNKTASLQCTFDFSARRETTLAFDYHMYGSYIDYLAVDIHDGSSWTNNVWIMNGQQHGSSSDAWSTATVDLTEFSGNDEVTVRFRTRNGEWNSADPAIDNVSIEVGAIELPYAESFESGFGAWNQSADDDFDWTRYSGETPTGSTGPSGASDGDWYLYIEGNDYHNLHNKVAQLECVFDFSRVRGAELSFDYHMYGTNIDYLAVDVFDGSSWATDVWRKDGAQHAGSEDPWSTAVVDLSDYAGSDEVTVRFRAKEKYWHVSDIAIDNVVVEETPPELPYAESFEDGWGIWVQSADDDLDWTRHSGGTETGNTGPSGAADGDWYLYVENHDDGAYYKTAQVDFTLDFSAAVSPELTFDYHMYGVYIDYLSVDVHDGVSWTTDVWLQVGQAQSSSDDPWLSAAVDLSAFAGIDEVTIRFRSKQKQWHAADTAIDHIRVAEAEVLVETAYELWSGTVFAEAPEGTDAAVSGNPDGDRFTNLQEWALVLDPLVADSPALQVSMDDADGFTVTYSRRTSDEVTVHAAWSSALDSTDWRVAGDGMTETVVGSDGDVETVSATVPFDANQKFIRLEIEE